MGLGNKVVAHYDQSPVSLLAWIDTNLLLLWSGAIECHSATYLGHVCSKVMTSQENV